MNDEISLIHAIGLSQLWVIVFILIKGYRIEVSNNYCCIASILRSTKTFKISELDHIRIVSPLEGGFSRIWKPPFRAAFCLKDGREIEVNIKMYELEKLESVAKACGVVFINSD
ncbi:hypothetical protein [Dongshaea marina]|uniref:hypothetical protein n=1 Tax=Dongshaea marina TaxID=2047966 RepID=UPI00131F3478|nr:hypothetical protein [Dongshaea marina]